MLTGLWVTPDVRFDVIAARDVNVPVSSLVRSYWIVCWPPAVGPLRWTIHEVLLPGPGEAMFWPLVPSRFSAPQLTPVPGSPAPIVAYSMLICSLGGVLPVWSQTSKVWVVALLKFLTLFQSTTIQLWTPSLSTPMRIAPPAPGLRSVQKGAMTLLGRAAFGKCCGKGVTSALALEPPTIK